MPQEQKEDKKSFRKSLSSIFQSPAKKNYNKVLASSYQSQTQPEHLSDDDGLKGDEAVELTDEEKAKRLVAQRDASSPTGNFLLGVYKPLSATQGYADYYTAKGVMGK